MTVMDRYLQKCKDLGFDDVEISDKYLTFPPDDWLRLVERVQSYGLKPRFELRVKVGPKGETLPVPDASSKVISLGKMFLAAGVERLMISAEGVTDDTVLGMDEDDEDSWRADIAHDILKNLPMQMVMFEANRPSILDWYVKDFGIDTNLFVDHDLIVRSAGLFEKWYLGKE